MDEENGQIDELESKSNRVNGDNKKAIGMNKGQSIEDPQQTVEHCC